MVRLMLTLTPVVCVLSAIAFSSTFDIYLDDTDRFMGGKDDESGSAVKRSSDSDGGKKKRKEKEREKDRDSSDMVSAHDLSTKTNNSFLLVHSVCGA